MKTFREYLNEVNNVNENNSSDRDYIDNRLKTTFGKEGFKLPKNGPTVKIGYTLWPFTDGFEVINDGISIKVKKDGKELAYFDKPKLDYKKAVNFLIKSMKELNEGRSVESNINESKFNDGGNEYESDGSVLFNTVKKNLAEAEKIYKVVEKDPVYALREYNNYFKKFEPENAKLLGVRLQIEDGFNNANIRFLIEFEITDERYKGKLQKEEVFYNLTKKKFQY